MVSISHLYSHSKLSLHNSIHHPLTPPSGATKGIGRAIALNLATRGCSILGTYSSPQSAHLFDTLSHTVQDLYRSPDAGPHASAADAPKLKGIPADITSLPSIGQLITTIERDFNANIDILVLNAAYNVRPKIGTASEADILGSLTANLHWPVALVENLVHKKLFNEGARVVVMSSDRVRDPAPGSALFNATKAGLEALVRSWAIELPVAFPGTTDPPMNSGIMVPNLT